MRMFSVIKKLSSLFLIGSLGSTGFGEQNEPKELSSKSSLKVCIGLSGEALSAFKNFLAIFERESGFPAEVVAKDGYLAALEAARNANTEQYDIYHISEVGASEFIVGPYAKKFIPVGKLDPKLNRASFLADLAIQYGHNGLLYAYPFNPSMGIVFVNKKLYEQAKAKAPQNFKEVKSLSEPKTWDDFIKLVNAVRNTLGKSLHGYTHPWNAAYTYEYFLSMSNTHMTTYSNGFWNSQEACFNLSKCQPLIGYFSELFKWSQQGIFHYVSDFSSKVEAEFAKGKTLALMQGVGRLKEIQNAMRSEGQDFDLAFMPLPYPNHVTQPMVPKIGGGAFFFQYDNKATRAFLSFIQDAKHQADWSRLSGYIPVTREAHELLEKTTFYSDNPHLKVAVDQILERKAGEVTHVRLSGYAEIRGKIFNRLLEKYLNRTNPSAENFLKEFESEANKELDRINH